MTDKEVITITGAVTSVRKDRKGFKLDDGNWYSSFAPVKAEKGDQVKIEFVINGNYRNLKNVEVVGKSDKTVQFNENKDKTTASMLVSYGKDIIVAKGGEGDLIEISKLMARAYKEVLKIMDEKEVENG